MAVEHSQMTTCQSLLAYNLLRVIRACLAAEHGVAKIEQEVSSYYLGDEIGGAWDGLMIALPPEFWTKEFGKLTTAECESWPAKCH